MKVGSDVNINNNIDQKHDTNVLLSVELKRLYKDYTFEVVPIILGATGAITKHLKSNLGKIGIGRRIPGNTCVIFLMITFNCSPPSPPSTDHQLQPSPSTSTPPPHLQKRKKQAATG